MKTICLLAAVMLSITCLAQSKTMSDKDYKKNAKLHLGLKGGFNTFSFSDANNFSSIKSRNGYVAGVFLSRAYKKGLGIRTELLYTTQGMDVQKDGPEPENIAAGYITIPHLITFSFAKLLQLQAGGNISFLLNAKRVNYTPQSMTDNYNRLKYGLSAGLELHPFKGVLLNGRYNIDVINSFKAGVRSYPYQLNTTGFKYGSLQLTAGYIF